MSAVSTLLSRVRHPFRLGLGVLVCVLIAGGMVAGADRANAAASPAPVIEQFHEVLLDVMKNAKTLTVAERYARIDDPARQTFDFARMARLAAGSAWRGASDDEKQRLVEAFARVSVATYALRFNGWSGQAFRTLGVSDGPRGTRLVQTEITSPDSDSVALTYVMSGGEKEAPWQAIDILLKGSISELAVRKGEYASTLSAGGVDGLIQALDAKTESMLSEK